ncbi:hypothetical protein [Desertivirga arenae]|uniref:hypothetical protein n=1 Tax=Desertivirga arenae TaxID=2810309 RepID=UPI001A9578B7|nr:hypothetical protein [Pedobacter sp. SYSU D00823]
MKTSQPDKVVKTLHTILSSDEKQAIRVAIERYKQTGKLVNLKDIDLYKKKKSQD